MSPTAADLLAARDRVNVIREYYCSGPSQSVFRLVIQDMQDRVWVTEADGKHGAADTFYHALRTQYVPMLAVCDDLYDQLNRDYIRQNLKELEEAANARYTSPLAGPKPQV